MEKRFNPSAKQIEAALRLCAVSDPADKCPCDQCYLFPFSRDGYLSTGETCFEHLALDACQLIDRLNDFDKSQSKISLERCEKAAEIGRLRAELSRVTAERDAAVEDMKLMANGGCDCDVCKYAVKSPCGRGMTPDCFEWRGPRDAEKGAAE